MKECIKPPIPATTKTSTSTGTGAADTSAGTGTSTVPHEIVVQYKPEHSSSLLDGTYSEEASAASFQEAVAAWREGRKETTPTNTTATVGRATLNFCTLLKRLWQPYYYKVVTTFPQPRQWINLY